ncbi:MAG: peptidylprolyl isomerase [Planctomycetes bacterium]|nr:peptidylprolyl isomerase [Planctomycetota bacterium]
MNAVQSGDRVRIHYTARFADGSVFASSRESGPLDFVAGGSEVIEGVSLAVVGMQVGNRKVVDVPPELAFGPHDDELEQRVALAELPEPVQVGDQLDVRSGERTLRVWVREVVDGQAVFDGNHPLAGQHLIYEIELVSFASGG